MRRQHFAWTYLVLATVLTIYGGYSIIYSVNHQKNIPVLGIVFSAIGVTMLVVFFILFIISLFQKKKGHVNDKIVENEEDEDDEEDEEEEPQPEVKEEVEEPEPMEPTPKVVERDDEDFEYRRPRPQRSSSWGGSGYVRKVGYGPVLRVTHAEILDMRSNTYYYIEDNYVKQAGSGPVFEISGNRIRSAFGGYLYEISGSNVNKVYGGFYASISGSIIQTYNLEEKYELSDSLNTSQLLAVVALLFGTY